MSHVLHAGSCLDPASGLASLPDLSVDHVITDPPYSRDLYLKFRTNKGARGRESKETDSHLALANQRIGAIDDILDEVAAQMVRVTRRWIVVFHDAEIGHRWRNAFGPLYVRSGVWVKPNGVPQISGDRPAQGCEFITIAHGHERKRWNGGGRPAVWTYNAVNSQRPERVDGHPCPKPESLMEALVRDFTDPGDIILDPFAGSGTTGVACKRLGRQFVGFERDPKYRDIAQRRIDGTREQLVLGAAAPRVKAKQEALL